MHQTKDFKFTCRKRAQKKKQVFLLLNENITWQGKEQSFEKEIPEAKNFIAEISELSACFKVLCAETYDLQTTNSDILRDLSRQIQVALTSRIG